MNECLTISRLADLSFLLSAIVMICKDVKGQMMWSALEGSLAFWKQMHFSCEPVLCAVHQLTEYQVLYYSWTARQSMQCHSLTCLQISIQSKVHVYVHALAGVLELEHALVSVFSCKAASSNMNISFAVCKAAESKTDNGLA